MAIIFTQTDTAAPLGVLQACAPVAPGAGADACEATVGGTAGVTALAVSIPQVSSVTCFATELDIADADTLAAGTLVHRLNVSTAQADLTLTEIYVCRVNSSGASQETLGSVTGLGTDISVGGVFTTNITLSAASAHNAGDRVYIVVVVANAHLHSARSLEVLPNQNIDTPFTAAAAGIEGDAALTLPAWTVAAAGAVAIQGAAALTLPAWTASGAGDVAIQGAGAVVFGAMLASGAGFLGSEFRAEYTVNAGGNWTVLSDWSSATSESLDTTALADGAITFRVAARNPSTLDESAWTEVDATIANAGAVEGDAALTLPAWTVAGAGTIPVQGASALTLPAWTVAAAGTIPVVGAAALTLPAFTVAGTGTAASAGINGDAALTLPAFTVAGAGTLANVIVVLPTTPAFAFDAGGVLGVEVEGRTADAALTLPAWTVSGAGTIPVNGAAALTLPQLEVSATGGAPATIADAAITLPAWTVSGAGTIPVQGAAAVTLPALSLAATGTVPRTGDGAITLPAWTVSAAGTVPIVAAGALTLPMLTLSGSSVAPVALARIFGTVRITRSVSANVQIVRQLDNSEVLV